MDNVGRLAEQILGYLQAHPNAADTKYGIARWWLMEQRYTECLDKTEAALNELEMRNLVTKIPIAGGEFVYRYKGDVEIGNG